MKEIITITIPKHHQVIYLMFIVVAMFSGCAAQEENPDPVVIEDNTPISLALACVPATSNAQTRLTDDVVQLNNAASYRGITDFHFIGLLKDEGNILSIANTDYGNQSEPVTKASSRFYHFGYFDTPVGVNGCLVYAKAQDVSKATDLETKAYNGCLTESPYLSNFINSTDQIVFEPVSIYPDETIPAEAQTLADALTEIATISEDGKSWRNFNVVELKQLFDNFTNRGYDIPGSAVSVRKWLETIKKTAEEKSFGDGTTEEKIRLDIIAKANEGLTSIESLTYPRNMNLPDGAAVLRWAKKSGSDEYAFIPQMKTTTLDDINSVSRFIFPPALYYFVNSDIKTSTARVAYDYEGNSFSWDTFLSSFNCPSVESTTKSVAIVSPLQYAVAQLKLKVNVDNDADDTELTYDNDNHYIAYKKSATNDYYFHLTGVIIGGQRKVGYNFKPINNSDVDIRFVYDGQVKNDFFLRKNSEDEFNTLVLQSYDGEDLNVILEFEYTGTDKFKGLNGWVYPGTRFYLVGEVIAADFKEGTGDDASRGRVFTQDYTTTINMTVSSLAKAYNVLPSILSSNLEIGVMTTPQWQAATPSEPIILD